jgi:hypothetical protein
MSGRTMHFSEAMTFTKQRPAPQVVCVQDVVDRSMLDMQRYDPALVAAELRRRMVRKLADYLLENCTPFEVPQHLQLGQVFRIEMTLNDWGTYDRALPAARQEGRRQGREAAIAELPYGVVDARHDV